MVFGQEKEIELVTTRIKKEHTYMSLFQKPGRDTILCGFKWCCCSIPRVLEDYSDAGPFLSRCLKIREEWREPVLHTQRVLISYLLWWKRIRRAR